MHDELNAIRHVYGEPGAEENALDAGAEAAQLAAMKAALDTLPPQRPAPAVLDTVVAAAGAAARTALGPIRTVYGEQTEALATPESEAEAAQLAEVKAALDTLPPQRPPAAVLDAVVAAAGVASLGPVRTVYDEAPVALTTPEAEVEAVQLGAMKAALDALPPQRPAPALIDAVVASAMSPPTPRATPIAAAAGRAADRPARRGVRRSAAVALSAAFALVLALSIGLWPNGAAPVQQEVAVAESPGEAKAEAPVMAEEQEAAPVDGAFADATSGDANAPVANGQIAAAPPPVSRARQAPVASAPAPVAGFSAAAERRDVDALSAETEADLGAALDADERAETEALPLADGDAELRVLYLRLQEMQAAQAGIAWDGAPVSLGAAPDSVSAARSGWMQVRVER